MILLFLFGLFIGSFLNMLIDRLPRVEQILSGRSHCDNCHKPIAWYDLIPVVSWLLLRGRCRWCRKKIPVRNVVVEMVTGSLFGFTFYAQSMGQMSQMNQLELVAQLMIVSCLIVIFFVDLQHQIIPDSMILIASLAAVGLYFLRTYPVSPLPYLLSALGAAGFFALLILITRGAGMGWGDVKFAAFMGLFLGFPGTITALYFAFLTGAFVSVTLILRGKKRFGQTIAFGPFLVAATILVWYGELLGVWLLYFPYII